MRSWKPFWFGKITFSNLLTKSVEATCCSCQSLVFGCPQLVFILFVATYRLGRSELPHVVYFLDVPIIHLPRRHLCLIRCAAFIACRYGTNKADSAKSLYAQPKTILLWSPVFCQNLRTFVKVLYFCDYKFHLLELLGTDPRSSLYV